MAQILVPVSDVDTGDFTPTPLWSKVDDDSTVNATGDGTEITSTDNSADQADFSLSTGQDPDKSSGHVLRARWYRSQNGNHSIHGELELWQGVPGTGTLIASLVSAQPIETSEVEDTYTLSAGEADSITDYSDLHLRLIRQGGTGGNPNGRESLNVDLIEFEVPGLDRAGQTSFAELQTPDAPSGTDRRSQIAHAELEAPSNIGTGYVHLNSDGSGGTDHMQSSDPGSHNLDIGEFEIIAIVASDDYSNGNIQPILSKFNGSSFNGGYKLQITGTGELEVIGYNTSASGVTFTSTSGLLVSNGEPVWIRATYEADNGNNEAEVNFYTSTDPIDTDHTGITWTQLGNSVTISNQALPFGLNDRDARIGISLSSEFFTTPFVGKVHGVWVYDAPSGGTLVADPDFRSADQGWDTGTSGTDDQGNTWDFRGDAVWEPGDRTGQISHAELETPSATNDRGVEISYAELETTDPPRQGQLAFAELEAPTAPRTGQVSHAEFETPTAPRTGQISFAELETTEPPRTGQISHAEFEAPDAARQAQLSHAELETDDGPRSGQVSHAELETTDAPRQAQLSHAELEATDAPRQAQISHAEVEAEDAPRQAQISFTELETADAPRSGQVSFTEFEAPTPPSQGQVSHAVLEAPDAPSTDRRGQLAFAELETADASRSGQVSHAELETGDAPRQAQLSFTELETDDAPRSAQLAYAELEAEDAPRAGQLSFAELETGDEPRSGQVSFAELETDTAPRSGQVAHAEFEAPSPDREGQVSYAALETPDAPSTDRRGQVSFTEIEAPDGPRSAQISHAEMEADEAPRSGQISFAEIETEDAPRSAQIAFAEVETDDAARRLEVSYAALETDEAPRAAQIAHAEIEAPAEPRSAQIGHAELETPPAARSAEISHAEFETSDPGDNRSAEIAYAAVEAPFRPFGLPTKKRHQTGRRTRARRLRDKMKHRKRYNRHRNPG